LEKYAFSNKFLKTTKSQKRVNTQKRGAKAQQEQELTKREVTKRKTQRVLISTCSLNTGRKHRQHKS
jgi:23S rRNA-/tRNA-specific pseudouridylate synthase